MTHIINSIQDCALIILDIKMLPWHIHGSSETHRYYTVAHGFIYRTILINIGVVVSFWPASGSRHMSHLIRNSRRQTTGCTKQNFSLRTSPSCSRGHSFREINGLENTHPSEEYTAQRMLLLSRNQWPRGHSCFRGIYCPEDAPLSESVATPRSILPVPSKTVIATDFIDIRLHSWSLLRRQVISRFKRCNNYFSADCYRK